MSYRSFEIFSTVSLLYAKYRCVPAPIEESRSRDLDVSIRADISISNAHARNYLHCSEPRRINLGEKNNSSAPIPSPSRDSAARVVRVTRLALIAGTNTNSLSIVKSIVSWIVAESSANFLVGSSRDVCIVLLTCYGRLYRYVNVFYREHIYTRAYIHVRTENATPVSNLTLNAAQLLVGETDIS